jgi:RNA recognition motif-containing protein
MSKKLHVANLSSWVTDQDLSDKFSRYGTVDFAVVICDAISGESRGFGLVEMADIASAEQAVKWLNFSSYEGQIMAVSLFNDRRLAH